MSTISPSTASPSPPPSGEEDRFRYGWRFVRVTRLDGTRELEQVPLTLEDVLYPEANDFIVHTDMHGEDCMYLKSVLKTRLSGEPRAVVLSDCRVDWNIPGVRPLGPDVAVLFGFRRRRDWATFHVGRERSRPALVIEVTSPDTRGHDLTEKVELYHRARIPFYVIADVHERGGERRLTLIGYRYEPGQYVKFDPDAEGRLWLDPVRLWLGITCDQTGRFERLALFDPDTGRELEDNTQVRISLAAAEVRVRTEAKARTKAETRARTEARARAKAEARAREAEEKLRQIEAELRGLKGGG